jgi:hypothetical protein
MQPDEPEYSRDPITVTVTEACALSGFGPTTIWKFIQDGRLQVQRIPGIKRTLVWYPSLRALLTPAVLEKSKTAPPSRSRARPRKAPQPEAQA